MLKYIGEIKDDIVLLRIFSSILRVNPSTKLVARSFRDFKEKKSVMPGFLKVNFD